MRIFYTLKTLDPVILSHNSASLHNHESLDYISGSTMLGLFASAHYQALSNEQSWQLFHRPELLSLPPRLRKSRPQQRTLTV